MKYSKHNFGVAPPRGAHLSMPISTGALLAISGGIGLGSSVLGQLFGRSNLEKQAELQRQQMMLSNELNRRNALDAGVLERQAKQGAGLNINSDKGQFQVAGSSALPVSSQNNPSMQAVDPSVMSALSENSLVPSKETLNYASAGEKNSVIPGNEANSEMLQARAERYNEILGLEIAQSEKNVGLTNEQILNEQAKRGEIEQNTNLIVETIEQVRATVRNLDANTAYLKMKEVWDKKEMQAHIAEMYSLADYYKKAGAAAVAQAKASLGNAIANLQDAITRAFVAPSEKAANEAQADIARIQKQLTEKYGDAEKVSNLIGGVVGTAATVFFAGGAAKLLFKGGTSLYNGTKIGFTAP